MNRIIFRGVIILINILIVSSPILNSSIVQTENEISSNNNEIFYKNMNSQNKIKIAIYHTKEDGGYDFSIKEIFAEKYKEILYNVSKKISQTKTFDKSFFNIHELLIENDILDENIKSDDIFGNKTSLIFNSTAYNLSVMEPFVSLYAPVIAVGMGFGAGVGDKVGGATGLLHSGGIIGLGGVLCLDALAKTLYVQYTFTFPLLLHIFSSFIGIMMFPVSFDFISDNYLPLFIYSNFVAIGYSAVVIGFPIGL